MVARPCVRGKHHLSLRGHVPPWPPCVITTSKSQTYVSIGFPRKAPLHGLGGQVELVHPKAPSSSFRPYTCRTHKDTLGSSESVQARPIPHLNLHSRLHDAVIRLVLFTSIPQGHAPYWIHLNVACGRIHPLRGDAFDTIRSHITGGWEWPNKGGWNKCIMERLFSLFLFFMTFYLCATQWQTSMENCTTGKSPVSRLLLILRGEVFRHGNQFTRDTLGDPKEQLLALHKFKERVVQPLTKLGWDTTVVADVVVSDDSRAKIYTEAYQKHGFQRIRVAKQVSSTQVQGWISSFEYACKAMSGDYAVLIVRADMVFKADYPLPSPSKLCGPPSYLALFLARKEKHITAEGNPRICDVSLFVPNALQDNFLQVLHAHGTENSLHPFLDWTAPVETLYFSRHGSNPQRDWNPLYFFVGRQRKMVTEPLRLTGAAQEFLNGSARQFEGTRLHVPPYTIQTIGRGLDEESSIQVSLFLPNLEPPSMPHLSHLSLQTTRDALIVVSPEERIKTIVSLPQEICVERVAAVWKKAERMLSVQSPILKRGCGIPFLGRRTSKHSFSTSVQRGDGYSK
eukprot:scaffold1328_cov375-Pavlova_lutheri.AAC.21